MHFNELSNEARRHLINVQQRAMAYRDVEHDMKRRYAGSMRWKEVAGHEYLYRKRGRVEKSLGVRSPETEAAYNAFQDGRVSSEQRYLGLKAMLEDFARTNRILQINRVPRLIARILRRLDAAGVLGDQVCVVGTNALYAYEAHAGIIFERDLMATDDVDLALDARKNLTLAARTMPRGLIGLLREVDTSFAPLNRNSYSAVNSSGLMVDLITPQPRDRMAVIDRRLRRLGNEQDDISAIEIPRLEMIVDAPRFSELAVAEDGLPVWISAADPRWWCAHKLWLSQEPGRAAMKRQRDGDQAYAVARMLAYAWEAVDLSDEALAAIPMGLRAALRQAIESAEAPKPEW